MQRESDRLCREYGLSVIENPQRGKSKHYGEWRAEQEGRPTYLSLIKAEDVYKRQGVSEIPGGNHPAHGTDRGL